MQKTWSRGRRNQGAGPRDLPARKFGFRRGSWRDKWRGKIFLSFHRYLNKNNSPSWILQKNSPLRRKTDPLQVDSHHFSWLLLVVRWQTKRKKLKKASLREARKYFHLGTRCFVKIAEKIFAKINLAGRVFWFSWEMKLRRAAGRREQVFREKACQTASDVIFWNTRQPGCRNSKRTGGSDGTQNRIRSQSHWPQP